MQKSSRDIAIGALVCVVAFALCAPFLSYVPWIGDEGILLHGADQMVRGKRLYVDFFEFYPPGGLLLTDAWLRIAGGSILSFRLFSIAWIVAIAGLTYFACLKASGRWMVSAFLALAWVGLSQGDLTQVSHHYMTTALTLASLLGALQGGARGALLSGLFAGASGMVTPTRGALAALAGLAAVSGPWRQRLLYVVSCGAATLLCLIYLAVQGTIGPAYQDVIVWTFSQYSAIQSVPYSSGMDYQNRPLRYAFPLDLVIWVAAVARARDAWRDTALRACAVFALAGFLGCYPRPDGWHVTWCVPLALPLIACGYDRLAARWSWRWQAAIVVVALLTVAHGAWGYLRAAQRVLTAHKEATPAGSAVFDEHGVGAIARAVSATPAGDGVFYYPYMPLMPMLTRHPHMASQDVFVAGYNSPAQYRVACREVMTGAKWVVYDHLWTDPTYLREHFPKLPNPLPAETRNLEHALQIGFARVGGEGRFDLMRRTENAKLALCDW